MVLATVAGVAVATQSRINGELGVRLGDGTAAAVVSFGTGLLLLLVLVPATKAGRRGLATLRTALSRGTLRPWQCLGGACGAFLVFTQGATVGTLGVAVFTVAVVAGQSASSLLVDRAGIGPSGRRPVTGARLAGAALTVVAVLLAVSERFREPTTLGLAVLPLLAGVAVAWQQAVNGWVRMVTDSTLTATLVNFSAGTAVLLVAFVGSLALRGPPPGGLPDDLWLYLGGPIGIAFIAVAAAVVRLTGVLLLGLATVAGQVVGAVLLDALVPAGTAPPDPTTLLGVVLTLVAVAVAALGGRFTAWSSATRNGTARRGRTDGGR
ncbi:DMT family transporter [Micromonospora sp. HNM0581]|nr:DMT family transporter [Micromonospora sp. HNM0581]